MSYNKDTKKYEGFIYKIDNNITNKSYIGQTARTIKIRVSEHFLKDRIYGADKYFTNIDDFSFYEIEKIECDDIEDLYNMLDQRETYWISYYDTYNNGYNQIAGGQQERYNNPNKRILAYDKQGNCIGEYRTMTIASEVTGANGTRISKSCKSGDKYFLANNLIFRFISDPLTDNDIEKIKLKYPIIYQYSLDGKLLNLFDSLSSAAKYMCDKLGVDTIKSRDISRSCDRSKHTAFGFVWRSYPNEFVLEEDKGKEIIYKPNRVIEQRNLITGELINIYKTFVDAAKATGGNASYIGAVVNRVGNFYSSGGYYWCYKGDFDKDYFNSISPLCVAVDQIDDNGNIIKTFDSIQQAEIEHGGQGSSPNICQACSRGNKSYGYYWQYHNRSSQ